ncbi:TetR/AcrR family transcriptional regulator [Lentzea flava]|uniref:TetR family transcriptional regulator n=1 Tax=Lentzea flava TaxID=103732 RepID=A0ABQ2V4W4_9PSEU|nr:TetR/AcrR family transcriptional regulator [Lentzea flava]MCP2203408.1 transcriptional regulator, TetR family [Lentzea flava]GGU68105.1 TetR family transcriptional regulator [Lentzea flava]
MTDVVPDALRRLWGLAEPSRLGRPAALDLGRIVSTAVELADAEGLAGVTLPKVAKALGFTPMSLYRYVGSKDELLVLMTDAAVGTPPRIDEPSWRDGLTQWAFAQWQLYRRRPWLARMPLSGSPSGPNQIAWMESALAVLRDTGLDWTRKVGVLNLVGGYVRHAAVQADDLAAARVPGVDKVNAERDYGRALAQLVDPERFPEVAKLFASAVFEAPVETPEDNDFTIGLEFILDGIATAVAHR